MHIVYLLVIGLIIGALAKFVTPGKDPGGIAITILLGIAGSLFAAFIGSQTHWYEPGPVANLVASVLGAVLLLGLYRLFFKHE